VLPRRTEVRGASLPVRSRESFSPVLGVR